MISAKKNGPRFFRCVEIGNEKVNIFFLFFYRAISESERESNQTITSNIVFKGNPDINLYIFAGLVLITGCSNIFRAMYFFATLVRCSRQLHNDMFKSLLKAPMYFFDTNPVGELNVLMTVILNESKMLLYPIFIDNGLKVSMQLFNVNFSVS